MRSLVKILGSLHVAVALLVFGAVALFLGAFVESRHGGDIAQAVVYRAWWFRLWLVVLWVNILAAAWKKRPWKRHQTGFLMTHLGLLTLLAGGLITLVLGESGYLVLSVIDGHPEEPATHLIDRNHHRLWVAFPSGEVRDIPLSHLPWAWNRNVPVDAGLHPIADVLAWIARPMAPRDVLDLPSGDRIEVIGFEPHLRYQAFKSATPGSVSAVRLRLRSPFIGSMPADWVANAPGYRILNQHPVRIEFVGIEVPTAKWAEKTPPELAGRERGILQLASDPDGQLLFRSWTVDAKGPQFDREGIASIGSHAIWPRMNFQFEILEWLPIGADLGGFEPLRLPAGQSDPETVPGLRCRYVYPSLPRQADDDFWVPMGDAGVHPWLGDRESRVGFGPVRRELGFKISLQSAELDPPSSRVFVGDGMPPDLGDSPVRFNQPFEHAGFRVYQGPVKIAIDGNGRKIAQVRYDVTNDPGLRMKYFGAAMVALGIATMFWMRAYRWPTSVV